MSEHDPALEEAMREALKNPTWRRLAEWYAARPAQRAKELEGEVARLTDALRGAVTVLLAMAAQEEEDALPHPDRPGPVRVRSSGARDLALRLTTALAPEEP